MPHMSSTRLSLSAVSQELETLTDEERAALRASRFHPEPVPRPHERRSRLAHPGGALATNKAAALAKFLKRKLEEDGAATLDPALVERAVENAKATCRSVRLAWVFLAYTGSKQGYNYINRTCTCCCGTSAAAVAKVRHVDSFSDSDEDQKSNSKKQKPGGSSGETYKTSKKKTLQKFLKSEHSKSLKVKGKKNKKSG